MDDLMKVKNHPAFLKRGLWMKLKLTEVKNPLKRLKLDDKLKLKNPLKNL